MKGPTYRLDEARTWREGKEIVWAAHEQGKSGVHRRYFVATLDEFYAFMNNLAPAERVFEEVFESSEPARLFMDIDGKGASHDEAEAWLAELHRHIEAVLQELFERRGVQRWVLDSSSPTKQSRHVFYDACFASLAHLRAFMDVVLDRCTLRVDKTICGVDRGVYATSKTGNLRMPGCRKLGRAEALEMVGGVPLARDKCLVKVLGDEPLLQMPFVAPPAAAALGASDRVTPEAYDQLCRWVADYSDERPWTSNNRPSQAFFSIPGLYCQTAGRVHAHNGVGFRVYFDRHDQAVASFACLDAECVGAGRHVDDDLWPWCFPNEARAKMDACFKHS